MINKERLFLIGKLFILLITFIIVIGLTPIVFSKYETEVATVAETNIAFYLLKENYYQQTMQLSDMIPRATPYVYSFTISNYQGNNRLETTLEYEMSIVATTNLPLTFELYKNQNYSDNDATNIIVNNNSIQDEDGTYFKTLITTTETFGFTENQTNTYQLVVYFPSIYISYQYQDILELVTINIDSHQII